MRETRFRVKTFDNDTKDDWVYSTDHGLSDFWHGVEKGRYDKETVCQWTGLLDEQGKEAFEEDIVAAYEDAFGEKLDNPILYRIDWCPLCCHYDANCWDEKEKAEVIIGSIRNIMGQRLKVVGNIWDNAELVGEANNLNSKAANWLKNTQNY